MSSDKKDRRKVKSHINYASGHADGVVIARMRGTNGTPNRVSVSFMHDEIAPKPLEDQPTDEPFEAIHAVFASVIMDMKEAIYLRDTLSEAIQELSDDESDREDS